jgi:hypothetical protein
MTSYNLSCGTVDNFFDHTSMAKFTEIFKKFNFSKGEGNAYHGIDNTHLGYLWFKKFILDPVAQEINPDLKLIFGMFLDCIAPFQIHTDLKPLPEANARHFLSFLLPCSVDNDPALCNLASTLFFDVRTDDQTPDISHLHDTHLSHVPFEETYKYSLQKELKWNVGDLIWWDSKLNHVSSNFLKNGYKSKQAIVFHTYVL